MTAIDGFTFRFRGTGGPFDGYIKLLVPIFPQLSVQTSISPSIETGLGAPLQES